MNRLFLTSMCGPDSESDIKEMVEPIVQYFDGINWVIHDCSPIDGGLSYLRSLNLRGISSTVIVQSWPARHWHSMNQTLFCGGMQEGDFFIWTDVLEHPIIDFVSHIKSEIIPLMEASDVDVISYYGKPFLIRYRETLEYRGSPHWYLSGWNGKMIEWSKIEPDEKKIRLNVRPLKRIDPFQWISHYVKYYVAYPAGSNHCLLGLEKNGDPQKLFPEREKRRLDFRKYLNKNGFDLTVEGVKKWLNTELTEQDKEYIRKEKILNDAYRYWILKDTGLIDNHDFKNMVPIL